MILIPNAQAQLMHAGASKHENLFIYLILHMISAAGRTTAPWQTMVGLVSAAARICRLNEWRQRMDRGAGRNDIEWARRTPAMGKAVQISWRSALKVTFFRKTR